jgi:Protein of unknown function (DUF4446)
MDDLNRFVSDNLAIVAIVLAVLLVALLIAVLVLAVRLRAATRAYQTLVGSGEPGSLRELVEGHVGRVEEVSRRLGEMDAIHASLDRRTLASLQHVGLVRFNPFDDTGSDQSFAIALLDGQQDGIVISSLHGRANTRLFAKPVQGGRSNHTLSEEEEQAIAIAVSTSGQEARNG